MLSDGLSAGWRDALAAEFEQPYLQKLIGELDAGLAQGERILPPREQWLEALRATPLQQVRVVILGQDPYPTPGHAHGLSFSVMPNVRPLPKSLQNIYRELQDDIGGCPADGCLRGWAQQGVLLLNTVLTVAAGAAGSHQKRGWERFTDAVIDHLAAQQRPLVFILWGRQAQTKVYAIEPSRHLLISSAHPSPLSAYRGFFGSKPFSRTNAYLRQQGLEEIEWTLSGGD